MPGINHSKVVKKLLGNGLQILIYPNSYIPKVSAQLWYNVGSKHELLGQKGMAHLIEHMIFKGTKTLTESDINLISTKLSGSCNAFTSHDYTGYLFDLPKQNWHHALTIFADCMNNCTFKTELLNSELLAVIQELKMYKDNYAMSVIEELLGMLFMGHPYSYPIIGYKSDLWNMHSSALMNFYHQHYVPGNATLVVVGDVDAESAVDLAQKTLGRISASPVLPAVPAYLKKDLCSRSINLYRDVQNPLITCAWLVPGAMAKNDYALDVITLILGSGRGSRLYKRLVEQLNLATDVDAFCYDLFEHGVLFIQVQPTHQKHIDEIIKHVSDELDNFCCKEIPFEQIERGQAKANTSYYSLFEDNQKLAYALGKSYLATHDEQYVFNYRVDDKDRLYAAIKGVSSLRPELMAVGQILPIKEKDRTYWLGLQELSDREDSKVLNGRQRTMPIEDGCVVHTIEPKPLVSFAFPHYEQCMLSNGLEVLYFHDERVPKIEVLLEFKANSLYDPEERQGLANIMSQLLLKGTSKHSAMQLADLIEQKGMSIACWPGYISLSMQSCDCVAGLSIVKEIVTESTFEQDAFDQIRQKELTDIADYWDEPLQFCNQIIYEKVYAGHPYSKNGLGSKETVSNITRDNVISFAQKYITPKMSRISVVGDLRNINVARVLQDVFGGWQGPEVSDIIFPPLPQVQREIINHRINRDQVVLAFAGLSVAVGNPAFDKLLLFDQIFGGGVLGAMSSRLFALREQSGLFYTIAGSVIAKADKQPGLALVKTLVSLDRLAESERRIVDVIDHVANTITPDELQQAKCAVANAMVDHFESYRQIAATFLYLRRFDKPRDYFDNRANQLMSIDLTDVKKAAAEVLDTQKMITVRVGRI